MSLRLSGDFYKRTLNQFEQFADEPLVFPILLGFLEKASQSKKLLQGAKAVLDDENAFRSFFDKTRTSLAPTQARLLQEQEAKIREKLKAEVEAEVRRETNQNPLEIELRLRQEYEDRAAQAQETQNKIIDNLVGSTDQRTKLDTVIQLQLASSAEISAMRKKFEADAEATQKRHEAFVEESRAQAKSDRKHRNIAYLISAFSLAVGVAGMAVGWPGVVDTLTGKKPEPKNNDSSVQVRLASSGQCLPSDTRVEVKKDGTTVLPSSGTVCLDVPQDPAPIEKDDSNAMVPFHVLQENGWVDPFSGKSLLDLLNDGRMVKLFKQDGSSICLHMPNPILCIGSEASSAVSQKQKEAVPHRGDGKRHVKRHYPKRCP